MRLSLFERAVIFPLSELNLNVNVKDLEAKVTDNRGKALHLEPNQPEEERGTLSNNDIIKVMRYLVKIRNGKENIDDIDHLGNRRSAPWANCFRTSTASVCPVWSVWYVSV